MNIRNISSNQVIVWCALVLGLIVALVIGNAVGSSDMRLAAGLIAAIPAVVFYNKLNSDSERILGGYESFADEFATILSRQLDS